MQVFQLHAQGHGGLDAVIGADAVMLGFNVPAVSDLGVQRGVVGGIDPGDAQEPLAPLRSAADRPFRSSRTSRARPCRCGASGPRTACAIGSGISGSRRRGGPLRGRDWHGSRPAPGDRPATPDAGGRCAGPGRRAPQPGPAAVSTSRRCHSARSPDAPSGGCSEPTSCGSTGNTIL